MIQRTIQTWQELSWQEELRALITSPDELFRKLELPDQYLDKAKQASKQFGLRVTHSFIEAMEKGNIDDPLLLQVLPLAQELHSPLDYTDQPLEEEQFNPAPGVIHKYHGRVLLIAAAQCAINCRYCFRRNFNYEQNTLNKRQWDAALSYIRENPSIEEVILSGGDPLAISDTQLAWLISHIEEIKHIKRLRVHSRLPIVLASRITSQLCAIFSQSRLDCAVVIHSNHPNELTDKVKHGLDMLKASQVTLLNQTVLLKNVNDCAKTLSNLSKRLFSYGVLPYYLHLLDKVSGASHYDVELSVAKSIHNELTNSLSGYLVPKLVREVPHASSKVAI